VSLRIVASKGRTDKTSGGKRAYHSIAALAEPPVAVAKGYVKERVEAPRRGAIRDPGVAGPVRR
jgi:hypothetical protein